VPAEARIKTPTTNAYCEAKTALVLSGGGARAAYQVGVLLGLRDLDVLRGGIDILSGSSAGAINVAALAARADDIDAALAALTRVWSNIRPEDVFHTDLRTFGRVGVRWAWDLALGGTFGKVGPKWLLDTAPLRGLLKNNIPFRRISTNIQNGTLQALTIAATDLETAEGVIFLQRHSEGSLWQRRHWRIEEAPIGVDHILASCAIPIFFPPVWIASRAMADGCIRNTAPLRSAFRLGAERIIAIGVSSGRRAPQKQSNGPSLAQIAGVLLDAVMLDALEADVEHADLINASVAGCSAKHDSPLRQVPLLYIQPSSDIAAIAASMAHHIPVIVRYLMRGLGSDESTIDLASYLLFDAAFSRSLIDLGRADAFDARQRIEEFFAQPPYHAAQVETLRQPAA
jgi:NTE family protein